MNDDRAEMQIDATTPSSVEESQEEPTTTKQEKPRHPKAKQPLQTEECKCACIGCNKTFTRKVTKKAVLQLFCSARCRNLEWSRIHRWPTHTQTAQGENPPRQGDKQQKERPPIQGPLPWYYA